MNKLIVSIVASLLVGIGFGYFLPHGAKPQIEKPVGGLYEIESSHYVNGLYAGSSDQFSVSSAGAVTTSGALSAGSYSTASVGSSSSTLAALGSAASGHIIIASASTTAYTANTAVTANSAIILSQEFTSPIPGTTCKSTSATTTPAINTQTAGVGFTVALGGAVTGNTCLAYWIVN